MLTSAKAAEWQFIGDDVVAGEGRRPYTPAEGDVVMFDVMRCNTLQHTGFASVELILWCLMQVCRHDASIST